MADFFQRGISKRGDTYLRTLMIHGARAVIRVAENKAEPGSWIRKLMARRNKNVAAVALANKNARIVWALTEGVMYAILLGNALTPFIDQYTQPRVYGTRRKEKT